MRVIWSSDAASIMKGINDTGEPESWDSRLNFLQISRRGDKTS